MFDDRSPIYRQIAERIRADVLAGTLAGDAQVMSTTRYAEVFRINPATAAKAFAELVDEGILYKRRGVGMFVDPAAPQRLRADRRRRFFAEVLDPALAEARALGIGTSELIAHLERGAADPPPGPGDPPPAPVDQTEHRTADSADGGPT